MIFLYRFLIVVIVKLVIDDFIHCRPLVVTTVTRQFFSWPRLKTMNLLVSII